MISVERLLQERDCYLRDQVQDWEEAVHIVCEPLIEQDYRTTACEVTIYEITERLGPCYVLRENLVPIHANNQSGTNDMQMAVTVSKESMKFKPGECDVHVSVTLVVEDSKSHMEGVQAVSNIFSDEKRVQEILGAICPKEIFDLFVSNACERQR